MNPQTNTLTMPDGTNLAVFSWIPDSPKATIVIAHGYADHARRFSHVAEYLVQQGYAVYAADQRGHGASKGDAHGYFERFATQSDDMARVIAWASAERKGLPLFLLGHSMGGLLSLIYAIGDQSALKGLLVSATFMATSKDVPAVQSLVVRAINRVAPRMAVVPRVDAAALSHDQSVVNSYLTDPDVFQGKPSARVSVEAVDASDYVLANLRKITLPILIMHGTADRIANPKYSQIIYDSVGSKDKTLKLYDGFYHEIMNEIDKARVLADVGDWLARHLP